jgi:hypothetical protein
MQIKNKKFINILSNNLIIFIGLSVMVFVAYSSLFNSYFESDEWFYFTHYFPLTKEPDGALTAIISTFIDSDYISGSQHVVPIASLIYFLNTKFFGLNFVPYAFMSLLLHSANSFLVFLLIKTLLDKKSDSTKYLYSALGAIFFALSSAPMHAVTWAGFYGQNVLSVTFSLLCILYFKIAFVKKKRKFIYFSLVFLFLALFTKESTFFLFLLLPLMVYIEERVFSLKLLEKIYISALVIFIIFRFLIPNISTLPDKIVDHYFSSFPTNQIGEIKDASNTTNRDLSIHTNLPKELAFRTMTFPIKMTGSLFLPPENVSLIVQFLAPIITPVSPGGDTTIYSAFLYDSGQSTIIYLGGLAILLFCLISILKLNKIKQYEESKAIFMGLAIVVLGALPLVAIIFTFPRWGYATFFDPRHLYNPAIGAAILFPFIIFGIANVISKSLKVRNVLAVAIFVFSFWLIYSAYAFDKSIKVFAQNYGYDRREVIISLKKLFPELSAKTVFYFETDGKSPFGGSLPYFTSVSQVLTVAYYNVSPLPNSFFDKSLFSGRPQGYQFSDGKGFGYYISKKELSKDLLLGKFNPDDIYAFYYYGQKVSLRDTTFDVRKEMRNYLNSVENANWEKFINSAGTFSLLRPKEATIKEGQDFIQIIMPTSTIKLFYSKVSQNFNLDEFVRIRNQALQGKIILEKITFDKFNFNEVSKIESLLQNGYYVKLLDMLIYVEVDSMSSSVDLVEKIMGSLEIVEKI